MKRLALGTADSEGLRIDDPMAVARGLAEGSFLRLEKLELDGMNVNEETAR